MVRGVVICVLAVAAAWLGPGAAEASTGERALELVTPVEPVSATVQQPIAIAAGSDRVAYGSLGPMPGAVGGDVFATNLASRGTLGWTTAPISLPYEVETAEAPLVRKALSADLLISIWTSTQPLVPAAPPAGELGLYRRSPHGAIEFLAPIGASEDEFVAASAAADRVIFSSSSHLLPSDAGRASGESIYEVATGELRQVDVGDDGAILSSCGSRVPGDDAISRGGERVFFLHPDPSTFCGGLPSRVYLREGDATVTVEVSASRCTRPDCNAPHEVDFVGATPDGRFAFLATEQQLLDEDADERADLYRYDVAAAVLSLVSGGDPAATGAVTSEPVEVSDDGERVYFRSQGALTSGDGAGDGGNLYLADGSGLRHVAPYDSGLVQVSADGGIALIHSAVPLRAGDGDDRYDVYAYDALADDLEPVSFGPGFGGGAFDALISSDGGLFGEPRARSLSADGDRIAFTTDEPLLAADANEAADVYESTDGALRLVSGGRAGAGGSTLAGVGADGGTIFFRTAATLLAADRDGGEFDLYAARSGGGFPQPPPGGCDPCERALPPTEPLAAPATAHPLRARAGGRLRIRVDGERLGRRLAATGRAALTVWVPTPGLVSAQLSTGAGKREYLLARGRAGATRRGAVRLVLVAAGPARRALRRSARLPALLELRQGDRVASRKLVLRGDR